MTWTARTLLPLLTTLLTVAAAAGTLFNADSNTPTPAPVAVVSSLGEVADLTTAQAELVTTSFERFTDAGLAAPTRVVPSFHDSIEACNGNLGLSTVEDGVARVRVCWSHEDPGVELLLQEQALMHELAHAWAKINLDDARRDAFVEFSGSASWDLAADSWNARGTERAADLVTWALLDPSVLFIDFDEMSCQTWAPAFELLTSAPAPAQLSEAC